MKTWSKHWKSSSHARKQRKYRINAPVHIRGKLVSSHLSKELRTKHKMRSIALRKGDMVKVLRGKFKGETAKVDAVDRKEFKVYLENIKVAKKDGTEVAVSLEPSNLLVTSLNLDDKYRLKKPETKKTEPRKAAADEKTAKKSEKKTSKEEEKATKN